MATIKITSDLNSIADAMTQYSETVKGYVTLFESIVDQIPSFWAGEDANTFIAKVNEIKPELEKYATSYSTFSSYLTNIYTIFETYENDYNKDISWD